MMESKDNNLVPKPNQGLVRLGKSSLMSRGRELATRQTEIERVKGYRCVAWGDNSYGECDVPEGERFIQVSAGFRMSAGVRPDGRVIFWGDAKCQFSDDERFVNVSSTTNDVYGLRSDGTVKPLWKFLEADEEDYEYAYEDNFEGFPFKEKFVQISASTFTFLGLRSDGTVVPWQTKDPIFNDGQCDVPEGEKFIQITCGDDFAVGLRHDGSVLTWGTKSSKIKFPNEEKFASISAGAFRAIGIRSDGSFLVLDPWDDGFDSRDLNGGLYRASEIRWEAYGGVIQLTDGSAIRVDHDGKIDLSHDLNPPTDLKFSKLSTNTNHCLGLVIDG